MPRRFAPEVMFKIKEEIRRVLKSKFTRKKRFVEWIFNIVPIIKKSGMLRVCINFKDQNDVVPKDEYLMHVAEILVDSAADVKYLSIPDGYSSYNQILIINKDMAKRKFRCP